ncbi:hypothetical protein PGTUg99_033789 [Puccinia graminis f. sp. tritici]|uniref:Uncharacterized protein n=1 Tax=Puccinia graminis f. sp. tritici TaxID=56615 RepID=A0A5B0S942_PUCGR|nr:hypothetical protein PGTUg99_033789 [Puccinia graminis f. sp. tritici]
MGSTFSVPMTSPADFDTLPAPIQLPEQSLIPPNHLRSTSENSQMEIFSEFQGNNDDNSTEESAMCSLPNSPRKIILPVHIKYSVWMRKKIDENKYRYLHVVPLGPIEPYPVDVTQDPPDIVLDFFQRDIFCHLDGRPKLFYLLLQLFKDRELIWVATIANCQKYSKRASKKLNDDYDLIEFLQEAKARRPSEATVEITMANPKANERDKKKEALEEEFGTDNEQAVAQRRSARRAINPQAETATTHQRMLAKLYRVCLDHAEGSSEGLTFVNPENPQVYMTMGHERLSAWAQAIVEETDGVDETHPPRTSLFQWIPIPQPNSQATQSNLNAPSNSPVVNPSLSSNQPPSTIPTDPASHGSGNTMPMPGTYNHFNNDRTPLPITGVELRGSMEEYLATILIPLNDHHTRVLIEHYRIHHWTFFRRSNMLELLTMGFAPGPARLLVDGVTLYESILSINVLEANV